MNKTEIKKALYKQKPIAQKAASAIDYELWVAELENKYHAEFRIPNEELEDEDGNLIFNSEGEPAQLLIRWLV